jgi:DNA mismatch repair protein MutS
MIYDEYEEYVRKYRKEYGDRVVVLLECGSFYEIYDDGSGLTDMKEMSDILNIQVSRRNKAVLEVSRNNFEMAGFPNHALKKFISILLANNYTIVLVSQVTPPPNPKRAVTEILSPGTCIDALPQSTDGNHLLTVFLDVHDGYKSVVPVVSMGISIIDVTTGTCWVYEVSSYGRDECFPFDELHRLVCIYNPREVLVLGDSNRLDYNFEKVSEYVDATNRYVHDHVNSYDANITRRSVQEEILSRAYLETGMLSKIEYVGLEKKPLALASFVKALQFAFNHNETILAKIRVPSILEEVDNLVLSYNCAKQLDLLYEDNNNNKKASLLNILNTCKTAVGKRYFKHRLLSPLKNHAAIKASYNAIEKLLTHETVFESLRRDLGKMYDIERLFRKCILKVIAPGELHNLYFSLNILGKLCLEVKELEIILDVHSTIERLTHQMDDLFCIPNLQLFTLDNLDIRCFNIGTSVALEELAMNIDKVGNVFASLAAQMSGEGYIKVDNTDREGYYLTCTGKRFEEIKKARGKGHIYTVGELKFNIDDFSTKVYSSNIKIFHPSFTKLSHELEGMNTRMHKEAYKMFVMKLSTFEKTFLDNISSYVLVIQALQSIDFYSACAFNAITLRHCKPLVCQGAKSFLKIKELRHPIIEHVQKNVRYISNSVMLGEEQDGMLLYGINSAGKSSLMKSIGLAIIMAQAGMYVAASAMDFAPYDAIFTRISSTDDIYRGQSTFTKEILELRNILKRSTQNSLVIGDELCSGTESISALSIVSAGIITLASKGSSFVFATHLHDLVNIDEVSRLPNLGVFHLAVKYDESLKTLVYDRTLRAGNGSTLYGIEVCKSLDLDREFLEIANTIRKRLCNVTDNIIDTERTSVYSKDVIVDVCKVCNERPSEEVHHIVHQKDSDSRGFIDSFHKDSTFNLVPVCSHCHDQVHNNSINILGYVTTMDGVKLDVRRAAQNTHGCSDDVLERVQSMFKELKAANTMSKTKTLIKEAIPSLSLYRIDKIIKELVHKSS